VSRAIHTIGIVGVRDYRGSLYTNVTYIHRTIEKHLTLHGSSYGSIAVVTGGGRGVDQMVMDWCDAKEIPYHRIPPNIEKFGTPRAFTMRNNHIVHESNELIMFWDGRIDTVIEAIATAAHQSKKSTVYPII